MNVDCPHCSQSFFNDLELEKHESQVHAEKWEGNINYGESGDADADGSVPYDHPDSIATDMGTHRPGARERQEHKDRGDIPHDDSERKAEARFEELVEHPEDR